MRRPQSATSPAVAAQHARNMAMYKRSFMSVSVADKYHHRTGPRRSARHQNDHPAHKEPIKLLQAMGRLYAPLRGTAPVLALH